MNASPLPDILPTKWIEQIKETVKPTSTKAVLGITLLSGVITGLITVLASYVMLRPTANLDLEKNRAAEKRLVLGDLRSHLSQLNIELDNIPDTSQLRKNPNLWSYAKKSIDHATDEMATLTEKLNDTRIDRAIAQKLTVVLDELGPRMQPALTGMTGTQAVAEIYERDVKEEIRKIQASIDEAIQQTRL
jgi:hypothetical protein